MAVAGNSDGNKTTFQEGHALVIAVANYAEINSLPTSVLNDATDVAALLTSPVHCGYESKNVRVLLDKDATLAGIRGALDELINSTEAGDSVVIFFSGHGAVIGNPVDGTSALLPVDCRRGSIEATSLTESEFSASLDRIRARRLVVLLDACHSGGAGRFKGEGDDIHPVLGYDEKSLDRLAEGTGRALLASSRASETSLVLGGARNSVFTTYLLEAFCGDGLTSGDGLIRIFEVFNHVSQKVKAAVPGRQHPIFKASSLEENFPVSLDRGGSKHPRSPLTDQGDEAAWKRLEEILPELYPVGPSDQEIWTRAGGDMSRLRLANSGSGRSLWFSALRALRQGGGGAGISRRSLIAAVLDDYPHHSEISKFVVG